MIIRTPAHAGGEEASSSGGSRQPEDLSRAAEHSSAAPSSSAEPDHGAVPLSAQHTLDRDEVVASTLGRPEHVVSPSGSERAAGSMAASSSNGAGAHAGTDPAAARTGRLQALVAAQCNAAVLMFLWNLGTRTLQRCLDPSFPSVHCLPCGLLRGLATCRMLVLYHFLAEQK